MLEDFHKKQQRGGPPRLIPGMQVADPKRRIVILFGLLVLLGFIAAMLQGYAKRPESNEIQTGGQPAAPLGVDERFTGVPTLDRSYAEQVTDGTAKERETWPEETVVYLLGEARNTPAVSAYRRRLLPIDGRSGPEIAKNPAPWRFQFVRFRGELEEMDEGDYEALTKGGSSEVGEVHIGRVRVTKGNTPVRVKFVTPRPPMWIDHNAPTTKTEHMLIKDGWVRGRGIFVKNYLDVGKDGKEVLTALVVATKIKRDFETKPVESLESIPFQIVQDHPELLKNDESRKIFFKTFPKTLFRLVKWAEPRAGPKGAQLREKEGLEPQPLMTPKQFEEVIANPQRFRAKYFGGLGALAVEPLYVGPEDIDDDKANDAGIDSYVTGWIVTDQERLLQFAAPAALDSTLQRRARIRFAGYFYKVQGYNSRDGRQLMAPFLVLTELYEVKPKPADTRFELFIAAGFIVGIALLIFIIVREDKTKQDYRRLRRSRAKTS